MRHLLWAALFCASASLITACSAVPASGPVTNPAKSPGLSSLVLSVGFGPTFAPGVTDYASNPVNIDKYPSVTVKALAVAPDQTIAVSCNGAAATALAGGIDSPSLTLREGDNDLTVTVLNLDKAGLAYRIAIPAFTPIAADMSTAVSWANLQYPATGTQIQSHASLTFYSRCYKDLVTGKTSAPVGIVAQLGIGPSGTDPFNSAEWKYYDATWNGLAANTGNNSEYGCAFIVPAVTASTKLNFVFRYAGNESSSKWIYVDRNGTTTGSIFPGEIIITP